MIGEKLLKYWRVFINLLFPKPMLTLSIIIVSYNTKDLLLACIASLEKEAAKGLTYEIIVVDNASSDGSVEAVKSEYKSVRVIANKENFGFSKANNQGVLISNGRYVLFLNSDTVATIDSIKKMVLFMEENKDCGAATCKVIMPSGKLDDAAHRGFPTPWNAFTHFLGLSKIFPRVRLFGGYNLSYLDLEKTHEIDALAGAFMLVRRSAGEEVGWWDEDFFWYGEDIDFCYRLKEKGWKIYFVPQVSILHYKGVSGGLKKESKHLTTADNATKIRATNARFSAMEIFYKKHYAKKYPFFITWLVLRGIKAKKRHALLRI